MKCIGYCENINIPSNFEYRYRKKLRVQKKIAQYVCSSYVSIYKLKTQWRRINNKILETVFW